MCRAKKKQKIRDQKRLDKIVYGNRTQIKKSVTNRLDHLAISKNEDILKQWESRSKLKKRQKESFLKTTGCAEKLQLDRQRAEGRKAMDATRERRLRQKQAAMLKKARLAEERKLRRTFLNEKARIEKRQTHLLSLANAEKAVVDPKFSTSNIDDNNHH